VSSFLTASHIAHESTTSRRKEQLEHLSIVKKRRREWKVAREREMKGIGRGMEGHKEWIGKGRGK